MRLEYCTSLPLRPLPDWESSGLPFFAGGMVESGRAAEEVETTSPPLPPFFPPVPVGTGRGVDETTGLTLLVVTGRSAAGEVFGSFPPFPPFPSFPVGDGEGEERPGDETVELRTLEEETPGRVAVDLTGTDETSVEAGGIAEVEVELTPAPPAVTVNWRGCQCPPSWFVTKWFSHRPRR